MTNPFFVFDEGGIFRTDLNNAYQVIDHESIFSMVRYVALFGLMSLTVMIEEETELTKEATDETCGESERNVWALSYDTPLKIKLGWFLEDEKLSDIVDNVRSGDIETRDVTIPTDDIEGETDYVRYLDEDLRIVKHGNLLLDAVFVRQEFVNMDPDEDPKVSLRKLSAI